MSASLVKVAKGSLYLFAGFLFLYSIYRLIVSCFTEDDICISIAGVFKKTLFMLFILYVSGSLFHESGHYNSAKLLGVEKVCVKFRYLIILHDVHIHKDEEDKLSVGNLFWIGIGGFLFSLIPIPFFWYMNWIETKFLLPYVIILFLACGNDYRRFKYLLKKRSLTIGSILHDFFHL